MEWVNTILQGVLLGGLYAMFAAGLSLIFGVMRLVNIAHGDLIVLAAYLCIPVSYAFIAIDRYGMYLVFIPVYVFMFLPFAMACIGQTRAYLATAATFQASWSVLASATFDGETLT